MAAGPAVYVDMHAYLAVHDAAAHLAGDWVAGEEVQVGHIEED